MRWSVPTLILWACTSSSEVSKTPVSASSAPSVPSTPVLLIGVDGFACELAQPLLDAGQLPHIGALAVRGVYGTLKTLKPTKSPVIWTTIATGVGKRKHGIKSFMVHPSGTNSNQEGPESDHTGDKQLVRATDRKVKALWNILSDAGRRVASVGWWVTYPVEPINGVMVAQTNTVRPRTTQKGVLTLKGAIYADRPGQIWPATRQGQLNGHIASVEADLDARVERIFGGPFDRSFGTGWNNMWIGSRWSMRSDAIYHELSLDLMRSAAEPYDLFMVYYGGTDVLGHRFFRWLHPELYKHTPSEAEVAAFKDIIPAYYREIDRMVGELVAAAPSNANVIIVSDHGMVAHDPDQPFIGNDPAGVAQTGGHRAAPPACLVAAGPNILSAGTGGVSQGQLGSVRTITPTVLSLLGLPVGQDMSGKASRRIMAPAYVSANPMTTIPSHTPEGWHPKVVEVETAGTEDEQRREQLRALGYIE